MGIDPRMKILITGGAGFIGSAVCRLFVGELGATVLNVDKLTYAANLASLQPIENNPRYRFRQRRYLRRHSDRASCCVDFAPDAVMHLAAESHVDRSIDGPGEFIETNIERHLRAAGGGARLLARLPPERARRASASTTSRPTRCSARSGRRASSPRTTPLPAELALFRIEGRLRPSGARLARDLRPADRADQLLEQLRALSLSRRS